jgi:predicted dehydrogenase
LYAIASRDIEKAKDFAQKYEVLQYFIEYAELAKCAEVDAVYIATPHSFHFEHTTLALSCSKAVLCEKPLTVNYALATQLFDLAKSKKCFLMEAMWTAFLPAIKEVKEKIESGMIGEVRHIRADFGFKSVFDPQSRLFNRDLAGGSLLDIGIYPLFISLWLLGIPENVEAKANLTETGVDDECTVLLHFKNGATASLYTTLLMHTDTNCEIYGINGKISIPSRFHEQDRFTINTKDNIPEVFIQERIGLGYYHEIEHFNECLTKGLIESPIMTYQFSLNLIRIMDDIRKKIGLIYKWD